MKDIFCAKCQTVTPHQGVVDGNGEFVFTCSTQDCGRFVKFPADTTPETFTNLIAKHEEDNRGQVSLEVQEQVLETLLNDTPAEPQADTLPSETPTQEQAPDA